MNIQSALTAHFTCPVRDVLWGHVYFTPELADIIDSEPFLRLNRILQLGPVYRVYTGATHTRASHSIGVYHLGRRLLLALTERGDTDWISREGAMSFLNACLLHDLGHFPFTHSLKELPLRSHESLTGEIILNEPIKSLIGKTGADPLLTAAIIDKELCLENSNSSAIGSVNTELHFYRQLLSGCLDPDKLDYLNRDARFCGVPYGIQDVDFIISRLIPNREMGVSIDSRLIPNVEALLFSKYLMYRTVYWHRQVRAATSMVKKAVLNGLETGAITAEELYHLDDQSLFNLLEKKTGNPLTEAVWKGKLYSAAAEISYSEEKHSCLKDIHKRLKCENAIIEKFRSRGIAMGSNDLIIDVPEPVSFETGLYVLDEKCRFAESSSALKAETLSSFVKTLYTVRIFVNSEFFKKIETFPDLYVILNIENML